MRTGGKLWLALGSCALLLAAVAAVALLMRNEPDLLEPYRETARAAAERRAEEEGLRPETLDYLCARNRTEFERIEVVFYYVSECGEDTCALLEAAVEWDKRSDVSVELTRCSRSELLQRRAELERPDGLLDRGEAML